MMATSTIKYQTTRRKNSISKKTSSGESSSTLSEDSSNFTISKSSIAISKYPIFYFRLPTSSSTKMVQLSSVIWMLAKFHKMDFFTPKQEHLTMPVLRYGANVPMIPSPIYGLWAVYSTKWWLLTFLSKLRIWRAWWKLF